MKSLLLATTTLITITTAVSAQQAVSESTSGDFEKSTATMTNFNDFGNEYMPAPAPSSWNYICQIDQGLSEAHNGSARMFMAEANPRADVNNGEGSWVLASALGGVELSIGGFKKLYAAIDAKPFNDTLAGDPLVDDPAYTFEYLTSDTQIVAQMLTDGDDGTSHISNTVWGELLHSTNISGGTYSQNYAASEFRVDNSNTHMLPDISDEVDEPGVFGSRDSLPDKVRVLFEYISAISSLPLSDFGNKGYGVRFTNYVQCGDRAAQ